MQTNQVNIERAMRSFDYCSDGFITIDDLKAVIDNFVMPTTDELFQQLMHRLENHYVQIDYLLLKYYGCLKRLGK